MSKIKYLIVLMLAVCAFSHASEEIVKQGRALQTANQFEAALQLYKRSLAQNPTPDVYIEAGSLLGKMQHYDNAEIVLQKGIKDFSDNTSLKNLLALIKYRKGSKTEAAQLLEKVLLMDPENSFATNWLETINKEKTATTTTSAAEIVSSEEPITPSAPIYRPSPEGTFAISENLENEEQQKALAVKLYQEMMELEKWELERFISLHKEVIERCPLTAQAEESCWRLSNLYLLGEDPANHFGVIGVLEHFSKHYSDSDLYPNVINRLMISYKKTGQNDKLAQLYEQLFENDPDPIDEATFFSRALEFADALYAIGRSEDAQGWYMKILEKDNGRNLLQTRVARDRLAGM